MQKSIFNIKKYGRKTLEIFFSIFLGMVVFSGMQEILNAWGIREGSLLEGVVVLLSLYVMVATYQPERVLKNLRRDVNAFNNTDLN